MIHGNTCADGYWTDITRTYTVGEPSGRQTEIRKAIMQARMQRVSRQYGRVSPDVMSTAPYAR